ncbi:twin-arg-translocated uncharacterized repeat protein [Chelatococcus sambhunathii]|uniref:Twin-arg-translocated uncharacterized repeat protein n=1 Tax=Chelatococcus sambhunathii TaxID=363953 RepID=A0ABM9U250_9HYPH|nr:TIGR03808 family TAT-translocated repetitive protein [Chelatococcus sambhunathii]CUA85365.1 twin-arg-translocated uncharacterized repeat protein [Chelatococcus sambhunathii]
MASYAITDDKIVFTNGTPAGYTVGTLQDAMNVARSNGKPLFIVAGTYDVGNLSVRTSNGGGAPLVMEANPGTVTLRFTTGTFFLEIDNVPDCVIRGITFNANGRPYAESGNGGAITAYRAHRTRIDRCTVHGAPGMGIVFEQCGTRQTIGTTGTDEPVSPAGAIAGCEVYNCDTAIFGVANVSLSVTGNVVRNCGNNGILIWQYSPRFDGSTVSGNVITYIEAQGGGTGQRGNGVNLYRAHGCTVTDNRIRYCKFSAVRANVCNDTIISGNNIYAMGEMAIYVEETDGASGENDVGTVVGSNLIDTCGSGISVTNFNNGGRLASITGNVVRNARQSNNPTVSYDTGTGISAEGDCVVNGNVVECALRYGIVVGTNNYARNLIASDNVIRRCGIGIAASANANAGHMLVTDNMIQMPAGVSTENGIVAYTYLGETSGVRIDATMSGITPSTYPKIHLGLNIVHDQQTPDPVPVPCLASLPVF